MKLIDSHCHLNFPPLVQNINEVISEAQQVGVHGFIIPGVTDSQWQDILHITAEHPGCRSAAGLHPLFTKDHRDQDLLHLEQLCQKKLLIAIGEIGLDFYSGRGTQQEQLQLLLKQLHLASKYELPVILHVRKAHDEILATLRRLQFSQGGTVHAFNGSLQQAHQYIKLGFALGVGGAITFTRATKIRSMVKELPLDSIVLETDSPDMLIADKISGPNLPQYLPEVLQVLAGIKGISENELAETIWRTTLKAFRLHSL